MMNEHIKLIVSKIRCSNEQAKAILDYYLKIKVAKYNVHDGYQVKHGVFLESDVLEKALKEIGLK